MIENSDQIHRDPEDGWWPAFKGVMVPAMSFALGLGLALGGASAARVIAKKGELDLQAIAMTAPFTIVGLAIIYLTFRKWPTLRPGDPDTPRTRRLGKGIYALLIFAIGSAMLFISFMPESSGPYSLYGNGPIPAALGGGLALAWLIFMPALSIYNRRNVDEHDRKTFEFGETVGFQVFGLLAPAWWLAWRGGFVPQPDVMIIFVIVLVASTIGNLWKRLA